MWENIKAFLYRVFGVKVAQTGSELEENAIDVKGYTDTSDVNIVALVANAVASFAVSDGRCSVVYPSGTPSKRSAKLDEQLKQELKNKSVVCSSALGTGLVVTVPYSLVIGGVRRYFSDTIPKDRIFLTERQGSEVVAFSAISDKRKIGARTYYRVTNYSVKDNNYIIRNTAMLETRQADLADVAEWANIPPEIIIPNVKQLPVAFFECPAGKRLPEQYGKPITYGCEKQIERILTTLRQIDREFAKKDAKVFVDKALVRKEDDKEIGYTKNDLFYKFNATERQGVDIFNPDIRDSAYFNKLVQELALLEKQIGCSRGILTDMVTGQATATEVRRASLATFALCDRINDSFEEYLNDLAYAYNVLFNYYNDTPDSAYQVVYDRTYALLEDSHETFAQLITAKQNGAASPVDIRRFIKPAETEEAAAAAVKKISEEFPTISGLVGE